MTKWKCSECGDITEEDQSSIDPNIPKFGWGCSAHRYSSMRCSGRREREKNDL